MTTALKKNNANQLVKQSDDVVEDSTHVVKNKTIAKTDVINNKIEEKPSSESVSSKLVNKGVDENIVLQAWKGDVVEKWLKVKPFFIGSASIILGLLLWHWATLYNFNLFINFENVPSPIKVGGAFWTQLGDPEFYIHIVVSIRRIAIAYSFAVVLGIFVGLLVGRSKTIRAAVLPYIEIIRPIPAVAWIPLAILMWPTEESSIIYITFLGAFFPIVLNTVHGVEQTPEVLIRAAQSLGANKLHIFYHVVLPSALPSIAAGLAIGMGVSWFSLLAGEIISGQYGIGYFTWNAYSLINYPDIVVGMLIIGGLGSLSTFLIRLSMRPALRWKKNQR